MIIRMAKIRVMGPRPRLTEVLGTLQDVGVLHLADAGTQEPLSPISLSRAERRVERAARRALADVDAALGFFAGLAEAASRRSPADAAALPLLVRRARRARLLGDRERARIVALEEERALLAKYADVFAAFAPMLAEIAGLENVSSYALVVPAAERARVKDMAASLGDELGAVCNVSTHALPSGDVAVLLVLPKTFAAGIERALADARLPELELPGAWREQPLAAAVPRLTARRAEIPRELEERRASARSSARELLPVLFGDRQRLHDCLAELEALAKVGVTSHAFAIEGWLPDGAREAVVGRLSQRFGDAVVVETLGRESWASETAPVVLRNPRIFRPFEALIRIMPLPTYGSLDPTPFVAVFFPLFFGIMLGDIGYGALLAIVAVVLRLRSKPGTIARTIAEIAGPCAAFAIVFGALYGELFGNLGAHWLGLEPVLVNREKALMSTLVAVLALGLVHIVLGLILGAVGGWRRSHRHATGKGVTALMVLLIVGALLAALDVLPGAFFTPLVVALLAAFPLLIFLEGIVAPIELLSTLGNVLSYTRLVAIGTASVMLATIANEMVGTLGSTAIGLIFALLFHLVNFGIGLFSPSVHALRLHYVEFFGKCYSPGGMPYRPFARWSASAGA
jgi:V/A-type H+-transporting ATPase subunit I